MISYLIIFTSVTMLLLAATKKDITLKTSGAFISFCLIASLIYPNTNELFVVAINGFFIFLLISSSYKRYNGEAKK